MESDTSLENVKSDSIAEEETKATADESVRDEEEYVDCYYDDDDNVSVKNEYLMEISSEHGERDIGSADEQEEEDDEEGQLKIVGFGSDDGGDLDNDDNKIDELDGEEIILDQDNPEQRGIKRKSQSEGDEEEISSEDEEDGFAGFEENPDQEVSHRKRFAHSNKETSSLQKMNSQITNNTSISNRNNIPKSPAFVVKKGGGPRTIPLTDPIYAKPFEYGWKRELVLRAIPEASKEKGEVYYITPNGKRLRTRHDIYVALTQLGNGHLTLDNFTFSKEPLGLNSDMEIIRSAKLLTNAAKKTELEVSNITHSKRIPKPKVPKGASPPPPTITSGNRSLASKMIRSGSTGISGPTSTESPSSTFDRKSKTKSATSPTSHHDNNSLNRKKSGSRTPKSTSVTEADSLNINNVGKLKPVVGEVGGTQFSINFFANLSIGYDILLHTFQYLKVQELLRAGCVCRLWNQAADNAMLWRTVRMKNSQVNDWHGFARTLIKNGTKHLDLRKMLSPKNNPEETWQKFSQSIGKIKNLETIDMCKCSVKVVENLFETNHNLRVLNAVTLKDDIIDLKNIANLHLLSELRLKSTLGLIINDLSPLRNLQTLRHLSLTSIKDLGTLNLDVLGDLTNLESLELGECSEFSTNFVSSVLVKLRSLQRLRLEKGQDNCCTFDILTGISKMENLIQLELINFDIKAEFDEHLAKCTNIKKLLLIPTYVSQSATTNQTVLNAVMKLTDSLTNFTWAVTSELVRVTELYVDNCESNRRNKKALSDCIPILKPVPGILDTTQIMSKRAKSDVPQVEILPLTSVEKILSTALPSAKVNMIIIAFHATWRQSLVEN